MVHTVLIQCYYATINLYMDTYMEFVNKTVKGVSN